MSNPSNYPRENPAMKDAQSCPQCGQFAAKRVKYTWWGGVLGPAIMNLTKCQACNYQFNGKSGKPVKKAILAYWGVAFGIAIIFVLIRILSKS